MGVLEGIMCQKANQDFSISGEFPYLPWVFWGSAKNEDLFLLWHQMGPKKTQFYCRSGGDSVTFKVILPAPSEEELTLLPRPNNNKPPRLDNKTFNFEIPFPEDMHLPLEEGNLEKIVNHESLWGVILHLKKVEKRVVSSVGNEL